MRDGWKEISLEDLETTGVIKLGRGDVISKKDMEADPGPYPVYSSAENKNGMIGTYAKFMFEEELITWSVDGGGHLFYRPKHKFSVTNIGGWLRILDHNIFSYQFLTYALQQLHKQNYFDWQHKAHPSVIRKLYSRIPLPPLPEQKRIVDLISSVDSYIEALQQQLESVRSASNAQLEKIVSELNDDLVEVPLGDVLEISRGGSPRPIQDYLTDSEEGINWVKIADATRSEKYIYSTLQKIKKEGVSRSREVFSGDFILSNSMSFGRPYIMRTDGCIHDGWLLLAQVSNYFDEDFLYNLLNSDYVQRQFESLAAGSGVRNLNIEVVKKVKVKIPAIQVQKDLASVINKSDYFIIKLTKQMHSSFDLRKALLSDLLSGEHEIPSSYDKVIGAA